MMGLAFFADHEAAAELPGNSADGWHTWTVTGADSANGGCCFSWRGGVAQSNGCHLDGRHITQGLGNDCISESGRLQIYALLDAGKAIEVRALSPQCSVTADSEIADLGEVSPDQSIAWLEQLLNVRGDLRLDAMAAISAHNTTQSVDALVRVIENRKISRNDREHALFWLVQSDSDQAFHYLDRMLAGRASSTR